MQLNWKRIALVVGFIAAVFLFGYLLYYFFLKPAVPSGPINLNTNTTGGALPGAGTNVNIPTIGNANGALPGGQNINAGAGVPQATSTTGQEASPIANGGVTNIHALTQSAATQPTLAADGSSAIYYDQATSHFYQIGANGKAALLTDQAFYNVDSITWAPNKQLAVLKYPDNSTIVYDFSKKKQVTLPQHWKDFSFSPDSSKLVFKSMGIDAQNRWLAITNTDGSQAQKIESLGDKDATVQPSWSPNGQIIAMFEESQNLDQQNVYFVGLNNENFKSMLVEGRGLQTQWSTQGDKLLYSVYSSQTNNLPSLWISDAQGDSIGNNRQSLNIATWADKCTFSNNDTVYCAVPTSLQPGAGIFSDQLDNSPTNIYKINLKTGARTLVAIPDNRVNAENLVVTGDAGTLYFTDKTTGQLYSMTLK